MDKNLIIMVLLVLQLMVTFTSTAHHEPSDLGAAAATFFGGISTPEKSNVVQMPEDDQEHSHETRNDFVDAGMHEEDTDGDDGEDQFVGGNNMFEDDSDDDEIDLMDMDLDKHLQMHQGHDADQMDMDLEKHLQMHQGDDAEQQQDEDIFKPLFPHLLNAPRRKQVHTAPKMKHKDNMASKKGQHKSLHKFHAQGSTQYPTYGTKYAPQANDEYSRYETTSTYAPQAHSEYSRYESTPTYAPEANEYANSKTTYTYAPQEHNEYSRYETTSTYAPEASDYSTYETTSTYSPKAKYATQAYDPYETAYGQGYNKYQTSNPAPYAAEVNLHNKNDYKQHSHVQYKNRYPKKYPQVNYYDTLRV